MQVARIRSEKIKMFVHLLHRHIVKGAGGAVPPMTEALPTQCDYNLARVPGAFKTIFRYQEVNEQLFKTDRADVQPLKEIVVLPSFTGLQEAFAKQSVNPAGILSSLLAEFCPGSPRDHPLSARVALKETHVPFSNLFNRWIGRKVTALLTRESSEGQPGLRGCNTE